MGNYFNDDNWRININLSKFLGPHRIFNLTEFRLKIQQEGQKFNHAFGRGFYVFIYNIQMIKNLCQNTIPTIRRLRYAIH